MTPQTDKRLSVGHARRRLTAAVASVLALLGVGAAPCVASAAETRLFHLPSEPLEAALVRFAVQGGVSVGGLPARGCDGRSRAVTGVMTSARALAALLPAGCGFDILDSRSFRVTGRPTAAAAIARAATAALETAPSARIDEVVVTAEKRPEFVGRSASAVSVLTA